MVYHTFNPPDLNGDSYLIIQWIADSYIHTKDIFLYFGK